MFVAGAKPYKQRDFYYITTLTTNFYIELKNI
nr:MAG TPA: hypothetical protein [Caudoviricetes sp.]